MKYLIISLYFYTDNKEKNVLLLNNNKKRGNRRILKSKKMLKKRNLNKNCTNQIVKPEGPFKCKICYGNNEKPEEFELLSQARFHIIHVHGINEKEYRINRHNYLTNINEIERKTCPLCEEKVGLHVSYNNL